MALERLLLGKLIALSWSFMGKILEKDCVMKGSTCRF